MKCCSRESSSGCTSSTTADTVGTADVLGHSYRQCVERCSLLQEGLRLSYSGPVQGSCSVIGGALCHQDCYRKS